MLIVTGLIAAAMLGFALSPILLLSLGLFLVIDAMRDVRIPLQTAWINHKLDSHIRATVHSMFGQVDAIGQMVGGPIVAVIAAFGSTIASLVTSSLLLTPALWFISRANGMESAEITGEETEARPAD
jgi:MFS transporter, DHA3 family, tetracycline resistance protein